ncbi:PLP-dependent aminotransferase family protein [Actinotignum schaalii]|uniref:hypothetical protein n=1 Tax=Actinotignum schaalii TaxID=59505 RepID=UPI00047C5FBD|nr:hypothetical protein [Actinotignum schaalii]AIE83310.1 hypothetical protein FB03_08780 [Actinotignum schaalii]WQN45519.1 hypothetical protein U4A90_02140 [Actinotignum schaalii]
MMVFSAALTFGGEFTSLPTRSASHALPVPPGAVLVQSGRQALGLVAQALAARGIRSLIAPGFLCATAIEPFQLEGIRVRWVQVGPDLLPAPARLAELLTEPRRCAVLVSTTFGAWPAPELRAVLEEWERRGGAVVADLTHAPFSAATIRKVPTRYAVASLRKWFPIPDGAWALGAALPAAAAENALAREATRCGLLQLRGEEHDGAAEAAIDAALSPNPMSGAAQDILGHLDVGAALERRRANARALREALVGEGVPEAAIFGDGEGSGGAENGWVPNGAATSGEATSCNATDSSESTSHAPYALALRLDDLPPDWAAAHKPHNSHTIAEHLAARGVYTPAFWPRLSHSVDWPHILALPIDQRYSPGQMSELARRVTQVLGL